MKFKDYVMNERIKRGQTINQFSKMTGVAHPVIGKIEKGYVPTSRTIGKILTAMGVSYVEAKRFIDDIS